MDRSWLDPDVFVVAFIGLAGSALGVVGLLFRRPAWLLLPLGAAAVLGALAALFHRQGQPAAFWAPPLGLGCLCAAFWLLRLRPTRRICDWAVLQLCRPACQWGALLVACPLIAVLWAHQAGEAIGVVDDQLARTDRGRLVPVIVYTGMDGAAESAWAVKAVPLSDSMKLQERVIQVGPPDGRSNCHGWVFTGGRYAVPGAAVQMILNDNGYRAVQGAQTGDLAIYRSDDGVVAHSGVVYAVATDGTVLVESKWDSGARYIHPADVHGYMGKHCTFYRSSRQGHLLSGIEAP